jgi:hypothetical protein
MSGAGGRPHHRTYPCQGAPVAKNVEHSVFHRVGVGSYPTPDLSFCPCQGAAGRPSTRHGREPLRCRTGCGQTRACRWALCMRVCMCRGAFTCSSRAVRVASQTAGCMLADAPHVPTSQDLPYGQATACGPDVGPGVYACVRVRVCVPPPCNLQTRAAASVPIRPPPHVIPAFACCSLPHDHSLSPPSTGNRAPGSLGDLHPHLSAF